jgi:hypothetical protein
MQPFIRRIKVLSSLSSLLAGRPRGCLPAEIILNIGKETAMSKVAECTFSGPYAHENLAIFLIHGKDRLKSRNLLTLEEALDRKTVIVEETGDVNDLLIENLSQDEDVFIQGGDIVKGGRQDRVVRADMILPAKSGKVPLGAFCVEAGRWARRGGESAQQFSGSKEYLSSVELKRAARAERSQHKVWEGVAATQMSLEASIAAPVRAAESQTSLQLTLEGTPVQDAVKSHVDKLGSLTDRASDCRGYALAINGKIVSADLYGSHELFRKLWPKLLKAGAVEAVSRSKKEKSVEEVSESAVRAFLAEAEEGKTTDLHNSHRCRHVQRETAGSFAFETLDMDDSEAQVRCSFLTK